MKTRYKILLVVFVLLAGLAWYGYSELKRTNADLQDAAPEQTVDAVALINAFVSDTALAGRNYIDKTILVKGMVKSVDTSGIITLGDSGEMSSVQCTMDKRHQVDYNSLRPGTVVSIKGKCNGYQADELLGTDVKLNFCVLDKTNKIQTP
jgi:hypothetical protein